MMTLSLKVLSKAGQDLGVFAAEGTFTHRRWVVKSEHLPTISRLCAKNPTYRVEILFDNGEAAERRSAGRE